MKLLEKALAWKSSGNESELEEVPRKKQKITDTSEAIDIDE